MIAVFAVACAVATQTAPSAADLAPERPYAIEFALGVAALEADDSAAAAAHFTAAGRLAPGAPLWPLYLAQASGEPPTPPALARDAGGPWRLLDGLWMGSPYFAPGGTRFATGLGGCQLWDTTSGALVAAITAPELLRVQWSFESSGRYIIGARFGRGQNDDLAELEVRASATGALVGPMLPIGRWVARGVRATWTDTSFDAAHRSEDGPWYAVRRFPLEGGTLIVHLPEPRGIRGGTDELELRAVGRRALVRTYSTGIDGKHRRLTWLVDPNEPEPLAKHLGASWGRFSADGTLVLPSFGDEELWVLDAESGRALSVPDLLAETGDPHSDDIVAFAAHGRALFVASRDRVGLWSPHLGTFTTTLPLVPPLDSLDWASEDELELSVLQGSRVLLFRRYGGVAAYDLDSGARLWTRPDVGHRRYDRPPGADSESGLVLIEWPDDETRVVDARTGAVVLTPRRGATEVSRVMSFTVAQETAPAPGTTEETVASRPPLECALVACKDGTLRSFELATGASLGRSAVHAGREVLGFELDDPRAAREVCTWDAEGRVVRLALPGLEERTRLDVDPGVTVGAVVAQHGMVAVVRVLENGQHTAELRRIDDGATVRSFELDEVPRMVVSDDGARIAMVAGRRMIITSTVTGATLHDVTLAAPPFGQFTGAVAFHGAAHIVLGFGTSEFMGNIAGVGIVFVELGTGAIVAHHRARGLGVDTGGGWVGDIDSMPELERLAYSVSPSGLVYLLDAAGFAEVAEHDFSGGNAGTLDLCQVPGSERLYCSGMAANRAHVFDARTLGVLAKEPVEGSYDLQESPHRGFVIGRRSGRVVVLTAEDLATTYERQELTGPGTRLVRGDSFTTTRDADVSAWRDVHVTRGGESRPLASFAAWLDDPLGLAHVPLAHLPTPPRFERGPERHVAASGESHALTIDALDPEGALLGVWVLATDRAPQFLATAGAAPRASFTTSVTGPWPLDVELFAVSRMGLESNPWRVRIASN
jgi:hypothetical protein